jgi:L-rhamnose-H+ transport protein
VLLSGVTGLLLKEWKSSSSKTIRLLTVAIVILITAVLLLTYGNKLGAEV